MQPGIRKPYRSNNLRIPKAVGTKGDVPPLGTNAEAIKQMEPNVRLPEKIRHAAITVDDRWEPGDLGSLIHLHGVQNFQDYGFNAMHEAYCAKIAAEFILNAHNDRSFARIARKGGEVVGSVLVLERPANQAQLRLLFVARSIRGIGLGCWLVEEAVRCSASRGFGHIYLWTVAGLDRAISIYQSLGFIQSDEKLMEAWGRSSTEIRFDLNLRTDDRAGGRSRYAE